MDEKEYINILEVFINSSFVKDVIMEIIQDENRPSSPDGRLIFSAFWCNPHNLIYGPGDRIFLNKKNKSTSKKLRECDPKEQPFDYELYLTQDRKFRGIIKRLQTKMV